MIGIFTCLSFDHFSFEFYWTVFVCICSHVLPRFLRNSSISSRVVILVNFLSLNNLMTCSRRASYSFAWHVVARGAAAQLHAARGAAGALAVARAGRDALAALALERGLAARLARRRGAEGQRAPPARRRSRRRPLAPSPPRARAVRYYLLLLLLTMPALTADVRVDMYVWAPLTSAVTVSKWFFGRVSGESAVCAQRLL